MPEIDYTNPVHRASIYIETLKIKTAGGHRNALVAGSWEAIRPQIEQLITDSGLDVTFEQLTEAIDVYAASWRVWLQGRLPEIIIASLWYDGLQHGIAVASGLLADPAILDEPL